MNIQKNPAASPREPGGAAERVPDSAPAPAAPDSAPAPAAPDVYAPVEETPEKQPPAAAPEAPTSTCPGGPAYYAAPEEHPKEPFKAEIKDGVFAMAAFVLGYLFCRWVLMSAFGWGVAVFTALFLGSTLAYLLSKGIRPPRASWFWFAATLLTGLSFALWEAPGLFMLRSVFLFCCAVYWLLSAASVLVAGKTGNLLLLDGLNGTLVIPFRNFLCQYRALAVFNSGDARSRKKAFSVLLGMILALIALLVVTPQLIAADSGGFSSLVRGVVYFLTSDMRRVIEFLFYCLLAIPTAAYLFGLVFGSASRRRIGAFQAEKAQKLAGSLRVLAPATVFTVLGAVSALYLVFILCQLPYFFSAFSGVRPSGWLSYADYARQGFFELCRLAAINLALLAAANILSRKPRGESTALKVFNILLALLTLLLIATAFSKMALYIHVYGLTILRILPCVFMALLAVVCIAVIVLQRVSFSIVRVALVAGAILFTGLCLFDADAYVVAWNTKHYMAGTLSDYDVDILYRSGCAGVVYAVEVYEETDSEELRGAILPYLRQQKRHIQEIRGTFQESLQSRRAWEALLHVE